jgi:hypothetical protein
VPLLHQAPDERRTFGREEGAPDFDAADAPLKPGRELSCVDGVVHIECD